MAYPILILRIACTTEGTIGCLLNLIVFYLLKRSRLDLLFRIHVFLDCHFIFAIFNPFIGNLPKAFFDVLTMLASAFCSSMFIFIPALGGLQLMALTRPHWNPWRKFAVAFVHPLLCVAVLIWAVPQLVPTTELDFELERVSRAKFEIDDSLIFYRYGGTMSKTELNNGRHFLVALFGFIIFPYVTSYAEMVVLMIMIYKHLRTYQSSIVSAKTAKLQIDFFLMQLLQLEGMGNGRVLPAWDRRVAELFDRERIFPIFQLDLGVLPDSSTIRQMAPTVGIWVVDLVSWSGSDLLEQSRRVSILPMLMLTAPFLSLVVGGITSIESDWSTISLTTIAWACPALQASVQIYYVRRSCIRSRNTSRASTKTGLTSRND
ncbi:hypothetical protein PRIPAC_79770 [Pristionchus pacificus]|uniref:Uncharacterized protein n=1 Tax=Pristionchus pacificus TaxID=54126 RepID=A0A2A6C3W3_PRIPA|nr:hypothetical protein PRIPAC_79770 [Pristionchus pacificus]|eukprot:PDM72797.1 hypothetical protein PRIPAC_39231 [Pristionchus pacificus]